MQQHILHNINVVLYKCKYLRRYDVQRVLQTLCVSSDVRSNQAYGIQKTIMQCLNETVLDIHQPAHGHMIPSHTISMHRLHQHNIYIECNKRVQTSIIMQLWYICWHKSWDVPYVPKIMYTVRISLSYRFCGKLKGKLITFTSLELLQVFNLTFQCLIWGFETSWLPLCINDHFVLKSNAFSMSGSIHVDCNSNRVSAVLSCMIACIGYFFVWDLYYKML